MLEEYLVNVAGAACIGVIADVIVPYIAKRRPGIERTVSFGIAVCIASCVILPLLEPFAYGEITSLSLNESDGYQSAKEDELYILERECEMELSQKIFSETGINAVDISIELIMKEEVPTVCRAVIILSDADMEKSDTVAQLAKKALGASVEVTGEG